MNRQGLIVDSQTLWDQTNALARHLQPPHEAIQTHVLAQPCIGADETFWRLMEAMAITSAGRPGPPPTSSVTTPASCSATDTAPTSR